MYIIERHPEGGTVEHIKDNDYTCNRAITLNGAIMEVESRWPNVRMCWMRIENLWLGYSFPVVSPPMYKIWNDML